MPKLKLNYQDLSDQVLSMMKTKKDNDVIDHTSAIYAKTETELSWVIRSSVVCDKN